MKNDAIFFFRLFKWCLALLVTEGTRGCVLLFIYRFRFCRKIYIYDLSSNAQYIFPIEQWISFSNLKNMHTHYFLYIFHPLSAETKTELLINNTLQGFRETHTWSSILLRYVFFDILLILLLLFLIFGKVFG